MWCVECVCVRGACVCVEYGVRVCGVWSVGVGMVWVCCVLCGACVCGIWSVCVWCVECVWSIECVWCVERVCASVHVCV